MHINDEFSEVTAHCAVYIPPNSTQYIVNTGDSPLEFLCIVDPAWHREDEEIFDN